MTDTALTAQSEPRGEPDKRSRSEWLLLAVISLNDLDAADLYWQSNVAESRRGMLGQRGWTWDEVTQSYISRTGQIVGGADLKRQAETLVDEAQHAMMAEAQRVAAGELSIDEWQRRQEDDLKDLYLCLAALACGGWANLNPDMIERLQGSADKPPGLAFSIGRLYQFAHDIYDRNPNAGSEAMIALRSGLYAVSALSVFEDIKRASHSDATDKGGRPLYLFERNILQPGDSCSDSEGSPGCIEETAKGWVPIGTLSVPGSRTCCMNCRCKLDYSLTGLDED